MTDIAISALPSATTLDGSELAVVVQGGTTSQTTAQDIADLATGLTNPMTAVGDCIIGGTAGAPTRLALGANGYVLSSNGTTIVWAAATGGFANPMTTLGDVIVGSISGSPVRLAVGSNGKVLTVVLGVPGWADAAAGAWGTLTGTLSDQTDLQAALDAKAALASPTFTGTPAAPTASAGTNSTQVATTAYADAIAALKANLASPTFTGTPAAPTASAGTNTTQLATTAYADAAVAAAAGIAQNSQSTAYTLVLGDANKHILHPSADTTARTMTIPANSSVAFPVGTAVTFVNQNSAGVMTIAITTDTMRLAGAGTTGSRTLAANGVATALKITSTEWIISGTGLT